MPQAASAGRDDNQRAAFLSVKVTRRFTPPLALKPSSPLLLFADVAFEETGAAADDAKDRYVSLDALGRNRLAFVRKQVELRRVHGTGAEGELCRRHEVSAPAEPATERAVAVRIETRTVALDRPAWVDVAFGYEERTALRLRVCRFDERRIEELEILGDVDGEDDRVLGIVVPIVSLDAVLGGDAGPRDGHYSDGERCETQRDESVDDFRAYLTM